MAKIERYVNFGPSVDALPVLQWNFVSTILNYSLYSMTRTNKALSTQWCYSWYYIFPVLHSSRSHGVTKNSDKHKRKKKVSPKTYSKFSTLELAQILQHHDQPPGIPDLTLLLRKKHDISLQDLSPSEMRLFNIRQSFREQLDKHFPSHAHQEILELGVSTIEDT